MSAIKDRRSVPDVAAVAPASREPGPTETFILALRSGASVEEAERVGEMLLRFREKEDAREAERAYNAAFAKAMVEMPPIPKDAKASRVSKEGRNAGTFLYSKLETILGRAQPVLGRHGLHLGFNEVAPEKPGNVAAVAIVRHSGGHSVTSHPVESPVVSFGPANTPLQNREGTLTALKRSLAMSALGLAVGGEEEAAPYVAEPKREAVDVGPLLDRIRSADSADEIRALKPEIQKLPAGPERGAVVREAAERIKALGDAK